MTDKDAMDKLFKDVSLHDFHAFMSWAEGNKPGPMDIYRPNYDRVMKVLEKVKKEKYPIA